MTKRRLAWIFFALAVAAPARDRIAFIEFYGYQGFHVEAIRRALPYREGSAASDDL